MNFEFVTFQKVMVVLESELIEKISLVVVMDLHLLLSSQFCSYYFSSHGKSCNYLWLTYGSSTTW